MALTKAVYVSNRYFLGFSLAAFLGASSICILTLLVNGQTRSSNNQKGMSKGSKLHQHRREIRDLFRFWIDQYQSWHVAKRHLQSARKLVFEVPHSGLGDIFKGLLNAYYLSVLSCRVLLVKFRQDTPLERVIEGPFQDGEYLFDEQRDKPPKGNGGKNARRLQTLKQWEFGGKRSRFQSAVQRACTSSVHTLIFTTASYHSPLRMIREPGFSTRKVTPFLPSQEILLDRAVLRFVFPLSKRILAAYEQAKNRLQLDGIYVGVHARVGQGMGEGHTRRFKTMLQDINSTANCLAHVALEKVQELPGSSSGRSIFVATDTPMFVEVLEQAVGSRSRTRVVHGDWGPAVHSRRLHTVKHGRVSGLVDAFTELLFLGNAMHLVHTRSGFSDLAFRLGSGLSKTEVEVEDCSTRTARISI